jgi:hypothetical protein
MFPVSILLYVWGHAIPVLLFFAGVSIIICDIHLLFPALRMPPTISHPTSGFRHWRNGVFGLDFSHVEDIHT